MHVLLLASILSHATILGNNWYIRADGGNEYYLSQNLLQPLRDGIQEPDMVQF